MFKATQYPARRRLVKMASLALASCALCASSFAQSDYPSKPIKLVVPYATGGVSDAVGRVLALALGKVLQQTVIVENRGGAGGTLGAGLVAKAPADGYTILLTSPPMVAVAPALIRDLPYRSAEDFTPIGTLIVTPNVLVVNNELPVKSIAELITYGKGPGKDTLSFASAGPGSTGHLSGQIMMTTTGINMTHIPYKSSGQAFPDVISGRVSMVFDSLPSTIGFIRSGRVKPLLVMSEKRSTAFPDVQTAAEAGFPAATMNFWMGIEGPAKLPQDIVNKLNTALKLAVNSPEMSQQMQTLGAEPYLTTPEEFKAQRNNDIAKYAKLVKEMGLKQE